jgi:hypothetical protein
LWKQSHRIISLFSNGLSFKRRTMSTFDGRLPAIGNRAMPIVG